MNRADCSVMKRKDCPVWACTECYGVGNEGYVFSCLDALAYYSSFLEDEKLRRTIEADDAVKKAAKLAADVVHVPQQVPQRVLSQRVLSQRVLSQRVLSQRVLPQAKLQPVPEVPTLCECPDIECQKLHKQFSLYKCCAWLEKSHWCVEPIVKTVVVNGAMVNCCKDGLHRPSLKDGRVPKKYRDRPEAKGFR
jgi:hypothetical protein